MFNQKYVNRRASRSRRYGSEVERKGKKSIAKRKKYIYQKNNNTKRLVSVTSSASSE